MPLPRVILNTLPTEHPLRAVQPLDHMRGLKMRDKTGNGEWIDITGWDVTRFIYNDLPGAYVGFEFSCDDWNAYNAQILDRIAAV